MIEHHQGRQCFRQLPVSDAAASAFVLRDDPSTVLYNI
jgi:hypothetical protein